MPICANGAKLGQKDHCGALVSWVLVRTPWATCTPSLPCAATQLGGQFAPRTRAGEGPPSVLGFPSPLRRRPSSASAVVPPPNQIR